MSEQTQPDQMIETVKKVNTLLRLSKAKLNKLSRFLLRIIIQFLNYDEMFLLFKLNRIFTKCMEININVWNIFRFLKEYDLKEKVLTMDEIIMHVNEKFPNSKGNDLVNSLFLKTKKDFEKNKEYIFVIKEPSNFDTLNKICEDFKHYYFGQRDYCLKVLEKEHIVHIIDNKENIPKIINKLILKGLNLSEEECCGVIRNINDKICKFDLGGNAIVNCTEIAEILKDNKINLKDISLFNNKLVNKSFETLAEGALLNFTLQSVDVSNNEGATSIAPFLESIKDKEISSLNLSIMNFAGDHLGPSLTNLFELIRTNGSLTSLNLAHTSLNDNGLTLLCSNLIYNTSLSTLLINHNAIAFHLTTEGLEIIKESLKRNKTLRKIDLSNNKILDFKNLGQSLMENRSIESLTMNFVNMTDKFVGLGEGLVNNNVIQELEFGFCGLTDKDAVSLAEIIKTCPRLRKVGLRKNYLFTESAKLIAEALENNSSIVHFEISWNNIRDEGVQFFQKALALNRKIEYLDLRSNYITEKGCNCVFELLKENKYIKKIDLSYNNIPDEFYKSHIVDFKRIRFFFIE